MERFFQAAACVLLAVILSVLLERQSRDLWLLLSIAAACAVLFAVLYYLQPVMTFLRRLQTLGGLDESLTAVLFKATGILVISELAGLICADTGLGSLGKAIRILAAAVVLWLSIPMMTQLLELVQRMMGEL